jgi:hypothetical protein
VQRYIYYVGYRKIGGQSDSLQMYASPIYAVLFPSSNHLYLDGTNSEEARHDKQDVSRVHCVFRVISYVYKVDLGKRTIRHGNGVLSLPLSILESKRIFSH